MKRIARPLCCLLMAVLMSTTLIIPTFAAIREQADQPSVTYLEEFDGFYVKNVSPQDIIEAFDNDPQFTLCNEEVYSLDVEEMQTTDAVAEAAFASVGSNYNDTMAATFDRTYQVTATTQGAYKENVTITYTAVLSMKTVTVGGKKYESFASIKISPTCALPSGPYVWGSGSSTPRGEIISSGARFRITHISQLETSRAITITASMNEAWLSSGMSVGATYYLRGPIETITRTITLPIYNVIY